MTDYKKLREGIEALEKVDLVLEACRVMPAPFVVVIEMQPEEKFRVECEPARGAITEVLKKERQKIIDVCHCALCPAEAQE